MDHVLMENRHGLIVVTIESPATSTTERAAAAAMKATTDVAQNTGDRSAIERRTTRFPDYLASRRKRKRIEEGLGWIKTAAGFDKTRHRGMDRVGCMFTLTTAARRPVPAVQALGDDLTILEIRLERAGSTPTIICLPSNPAAGASFQASKAGKVVPHHRISTTY